MPSDQYDKDCLKLLERIALALEQIALNTRRAQAPSESYPGGDIDQT